MGIPVYIGRRYKSSATGTGWKVIHCEGCRRKFIYSLTRTGNATAHSPYFLDNEGAELRARHTSVNNLEVALKRENDAVTCPDCGWYQSTMLPGLRWKRWRWMFHAGWILLLVGIITSVAGRPAPGASLAPNASLPYALSLILLFGGGLSMFVVSCILLQRWNPNADAALRAGTRSNSRNGPFRREEFLEYFRRVLPRRTAFSIDSGMLMAMFQALVHLEARECVADLEPLLGDPDSDVRVAAATSLCALGSRAGLSLLFQYSLTPAELNAIRCPEAWMIFSSKKVEARITGSAVQALQSLSERCGLALEGPEGDGESRVEWRLRPVWISADGGQRSALDALREIVTAPYEFVLDVDRVRILSRKRAQDLWFAWWAEEQKKSKQTG